jgi:hypothetical protein
MEALGIAVSRLMLIRRNWGDVFDTKEEFCKWANDNECG